MPRGGRREGAGRPPRLDELERLAIGANCERKFQDIWEERISQDHEAKPLVQHLRQLQAQLRQAFMSEGVVFLSSAEGQELRGEIEQAVREIRRTPDWAETNHMFDLTAPRPKGLRPVIIAEVALESPAWLGARVPEWMIDECWKEYRRFRRRNHAD